MNSMVYFKEEDYANIACDLRDDIYERGFYHTAIEYDTNRFYSDISLDIEMTWQPYEEVDGSRAYYLKSIDRISCEVTTWREGEEIGNNFSTQLLYDYLTDYYGRY